MTNVQDCTQQIIDEKEIERKLAMPFKQEDIEWRVQQAFPGDQNKTPKAIVVPYLENRAIQNRLDEVFGVFGWENQFKELHQGIICGISVTINGRTITKWDGADPTNFEATKGGISNSMKRAAVQWNIGRYLYDLKEEWVEITPQKQGTDAIYVNDKKNNVKGYFKPPTLPKWALPEGYEEQIKQQIKNSSNTTNQNQQQSKGNKGFDRNEVLRTIKDHEANLGLLGPDDRIRMGIFNKANPNTNTNIIEQATEAELQRYFWIIQPVSVLVSSAKHYSCPIEQLLTFAQIIKPQEQINELYNLFFKITRDDVDTIMNMIKSEGNERTA